MKLHLTLANETFDAEGDDATPDTLGPLVRVWINAINPAAMTVDTLSDQLEAQTTRLAAAVSAAQDVDKGATDGDGSDETAGGGGAG